MNILRVPSFQTENCPLHQKWLALITITLIIGSALFMNQASSQTLSQPSKLKIFIGPTSVPADNNVYACIFVQLQDSSGKPARALQDTTISLSSSLTNVGTVNPSITIPKGATYGSANFYSTFTPGTTAIAATATGYATVQASVTTVGPNPTAIAVYGFPSTLPADGNSYEAILVQLQDSSGSPAKAPKGGIQVSLSSSNIDIGTVTPSATILEGQTYTTVTFTSTTTKGQAVITPIAQNYQSKQTTITTKDIAVQTSSQLKLFTGTTKILADKNPYKLLAVQLQDSSGNPARATTDLTITIASSDQNIGTTETQITIPQSSTYALATLSTTYKAGTTTITAAAPGLTATNQAITTIGFTPSKLAVYCSPSTLPSDNVAYQIVQVQLQDAQGRPARAPETDVTVSLFSSKPSVGEVSSTLTIPFGETLGLGTFTATNSPGSSSITAQASSYTTDQATVTTHTIDFSPLNVEVVANPESILNKNKTEITAYISVDGEPITGATVKFASDNGGTFTTPKQGEPGYYTTTFTASSFSVTTVCTITASALKAGFLSSQGTVQITVGPTLTSNTSATLQLYVQDSDGNYLSNATVTSTVQPQGVKTLFGVTNSSGSVAFRNVTAGLYTFEIAREGYETLNQTVNFKGKPMSMTITLNGGTQEDNTLFIVAVVIVVAVVFAVGAIVLIRRRKSNDFPNKPLNYYNSAT